MCATKQISIHDTQRENPSTPRQSVLIDTELRGILTSWLRQQQGDLTSFNPASVAFRDLVSGAEHTSVIHYISIVQLGCSTMHTINGQPVLPKKSTLDA